MKIVKIALDQIQDNPFQPRERYDGIEELAEKIAAMKAQLPETLGLIHVPNARTVDGNGAVQLAEGHRRLRAFRLLAAADPDYAEMPVNLVAMPDEDMDDIAWSENYDRKALSPVEEARALKRTLETRQITQEQLASLRRLGRSTVANKIRLLNLPDDLLEAVADGKVSERQAMDILPALEIKSSDLDGAGLTKDIHFIPGSTYSVPTPNTLKRRVLEFGNLTGDQIRQTVEQIKCKVEKEKLQKWQSAHPAPAVIAPPPPPPAPARQIPRSPVCAQTTDDEEQEQEPEADEERDWLEPADDEAAEEQDGDEEEDAEGAEDAEDGDEGESAGWNGDPAAGNMSSTIAPVKAPAVSAPPPPPPPAPKRPAEPPVMWQITISIRQDPGEGVTVSSHAIISLFKDHEMIKSDAITAAQIGTVIHNMFVNDLPGPIVI